MIKKTIIASIILFISYAVFIEFLAPQWWSASQNLWQENIVKAQQYVYSSDSTKTSVIIGSSLSERIIMDSLPNTINLSFGGQGIYDGLNTLLEKEEMPKIVFIEMNYVLRTANLEFKNTLNNPVLYLPRKAIVALREDKQPIAVIGKIIADLKSKFTNSKQSENSEKEIDDKLFDKLLQNQIKEYFVTPDSMVVENSFTQLHDYIWFLQNKGVKIVFFEMPTNKRLEQLSRAITIRDKFYQQFPQSKYSYIALNPDFNFKTTDGVHLSKEEAINFTNYFKEKAIHLY